MKTLAFLIVISLVCAVESHARTVDVSAEQFMKKGIPYCTKKIKRGCVQPKEGNSAKYYLAPKYKEKKQGKRVIASVLGKKLKNHRKKKIKK